MGGWEESWVGDPPSGILAKVQNLSGTERWEGQRNESTNIYNLFVRFRGNNLGAPYWQAGETRFIIRGRQFNLLAVQDLEMKKKWLRLLIQEGDPA
jgi:head-tail adaptor